MSIDPNSEELIHFQKAAKEFPGRPVCLQTLHRWRLRGVRGSKLETIIIGGLRYTSLEAIGRFIASQNADQSTPEISSQQRAKQSIAARHELEKMGFRPQSK
jgi:hypothetical protein